MTLRTCPKCSAYYADELLAFCLVDGMPLISVDHGSERWNEGTRVIEEKTSASRRQQRRIKWRRIALSVMTTLMFTLFVGRSFTVETIPAKILPALTADPSPSPSPVLSALISPTESPSPTKTEDTSPTKTEDTSPTKTESTSPTKAEDTSPTSTEDTSPTKTEDISPPRTETSTPTPVYKISGRVIYSGQPLGGVKITLEGSKLTSTTTDANGNYTFADLRAGGDYTIIPRATVNLTPLSRSFNNLTHDESANFSGVGKVDSPPVTGKDDSPPVTGKDDSPPPQECSDDDKRNESRAIRDRLSSGWRKRIENERARIIAENVRDGMKGEASLTAIEYRSAFPRGCKMALVTLTYEWLISMGSPAAPAKTLRIPKKKMFQCYKVFGMWNCTY